MRADEPIRCLKIAEALEERANKIKGGSMVRVFRSPNEHKLECVRMLGRYIDRIEKVEEYK